MPNQLTVCSLQPAIAWNEPQRTFDHIASMVARASRAQPLDLLVLPEHFNAQVDTDADHFPSQAAYAFAAQLASSHGTNLVAGSVERWDEQGGCLVNTAFVFDRQGREIGRYCKRKLFGFERRRGVQSGNDPLVVEIDGVGCGILICADLWYPELVRELAQDAWLLCVPSQTTIRREAEPAYARLLWHSLAMTRAQENVLLVVVSDQAVSSVAPYRCGGVSSITDPSAEPDLAAIQQRLDDGGDGYITATVDLERLQRFRSYRRENGLLPSKGTMERA
jgi:predicted amidohydrolase